MNGITEQINAMGQLFVDFALPMLIQSSVLIIVLLGLDFVLRKKVRAVFRYWILMLILVKLVLPTSLSAPTGLGYWFWPEIEVAKNQEQTAQEAEPIVISTVFDNAYIPPLPRQIPTDSGLVEYDATAGPGITLSWQGVVFLIWLVVVGVMVLLLIQRMMFVKGLIGQSKNVSERMVDRLKQYREQIMFCQLY